ncbi:MAG TPA: hypothetical protein VLA92_00865 [Candidatus Saccharimonadales bacterium]|nr:hypothetical protein [Candidatus Saccharimonadales bacterium]
MASTTFYRNVRARDQLELFLLAAASSLLLVRLYLHITGYPQIGSGGLHIAHMLWGGALMLGSIVMTICFLGARVQRIAAITGGIGFGVFIDELGKFITRDNNYFYQPTIGIIYAIFIVMYLAFNFISRKRPLSQREAQFNALSQLEEAIVHDMDPIEKARVASLLDQADPKDPVTKQLRKLLLTTPTVAPHGPSYIRRMHRLLDKVYERFWHRHSSSQIVRIFFLIETFVFVGVIAVLIFRNLNSVLDLFTGNVPFAAELAVGQLLSSIAAAGYAIYGTVLLPRSRIRAYEQFRRATMVNIFLTQFFMFARIDFGALPGFFFNLFLLGFLGFATRQEQRLEAKKA